MLNECESRVKVRYIFSQIKLVTAFSKKMSSRKIYSAVFVDHRSNVSKSVAKKLFTLFLEQVKCPCFLLRHTRPLEQSQILLG